MRTPQAIHHVSVGVLFAKQTNTANVLCILVDHLVQTSGAKIYTRYAEYYKKNVCCFIDGGFGRYPAFFSLQRFDQKNVFHGRQDPLTVLHFMHGHEATFTIPPHMLPARDRSYNPVLPPPKKRGVKGHIDIGITPNIYSYPTSFSCNVVMKLPCGSYPSRIGEVMCT